MKYSTLIGAILLIALLVTACAPAATEAPAATLPAPTIVSTDTAAATEPPTATGVATEAPTEAPTGVPVTGEATVMTAEVGTFGSALVDGQGRALYLFTNDAQNSGTSACTADCLAAWPPLLSQGAPVAGAGADATLLGTITRDDGTIQVTYNGWPLYYYADDAAPGDALGQGMNSVWFLVSPTGEAIQS